MLYWMRQCLQHGHLHWQTHVETYASSLCRALTQTIGWGCFFNSVIEPRVWTWRCEYYLVGTDIIPPWPQPFVSFEADPRLMTLCTGLKNSYRMVFCMFAKERWGVATVSTSGAGHENINRMACVNMRDYEILLQNLVTYKAVKYVAFVMNNFYMTRFAEFVLG